MKKLIEVKPLDDYKIWVKYSDGIEGIVDLSNFVGKGVFKIWNNYSEFQKVSIGESGELKWNDNIDLCPDSIYLKVTGKNPEDLFPYLKKNFEHA
ncbi:MAG: DUF2442 domain-containing protein [Bacteroidetes bacterium]|nr:DUF2442 domain-containing protein [Bacteroidota bacterium]MBU2585594.1 DUF2442 domain-containing protein [Bacteroidota bacterium]